MANKKEINKHAWLLIIATAVLIGFSVTLLAAVGGAAGLALFVVCCILYGVYAAFSIRAILNARRSDASALPMTEKLARFMPVPLVLIDEAGAVAWHNDAFIRICGRESVKGKQLGKLFPQLGGKFMQGPYNTSTVFWHENRQYEALSTTLPGKRGAMLVSLRDATDQLAREQRLKDMLPAVCMVQVDNYDELAASTPQHSLPSVMAEVERLIGEWAHSLGGIYRAYDKDTWFLLFERGHLQRFHEEKITLLDRVREIKEGNSLPVTLSVAIGAGENLTESEEDSRQALELALSRGGDQAVLKEGERLVFFGGKARNMERRGKVRSRMTAQSLKELMQQYPNVLITGHQMADLDSLGSSLGLARCATWVGARPHIVLEEANAQVEILVNGLKSRREYDGLLVTPAEALESCGPRTLLIIVDVHNPAYIPEPRLLEKAGAVVNIDHHVKGAESITKAVLSYHEPYASSVSELVTEIIQYFDENIKLGELEAEALLAGITVDTKGFVLKTGIRTFEAASYLRRMGANLGSTRILLQDDLETFSLRSEVVRGAHMIGKGIAMAVCPRSIRNASLIAAQAADALVGIRGIDTSFVLSETGRDVTVSGRSLGRVNVQLILEKLGGGGHMTIAGARLTNTTLEDAQKMVQECVELYLKEETE